MVKGDEKMILNICLAIVGISGLIAAGSDGPYFPCLNFLGLGAMCFSALAYLKTKKGAGHDGNNAKRNIKT